MREGDTFSGMGMRWDDSDSAVAFKYGFSSDFSRFYPLFARFFKYKNTVLSLKILRSFLNPLLFDYVSMPSHTALRLVSIIVVSFIMPAISKRLRNVMKWKNIATTRDAVDYFKSKGKVKVTCNITGFLLFYERIGLFS